ncbi:MAG: hypothetical protein AAGA69_06360, partial [Pseudomonadota bacterium]
MESLWTGTWSNDRHVFFAEDAGMDLETLASRQEIHLDKVKTDTAATAQDTKDSHGLRAQFRVENETIVQDILLGEQNCTIYWRREGSQFRGRGQTTACRNLIDMTIPAASREVDFALSESEFWVTASGRSGETREARFRKVRPFSCWVAILRGAS